MKHIYEYRPTAKTITLFLFLCALYSVDTAKSQTFAIGDGISGPVSIGATGVSYTTSIISFGTGPYTDGGTTGNVGSTENFGGTYNGTFFSGAANADPSLATVIHLTGGTNPQSYDRGFGFHITFSSAIDIGHFGYFDLDGYLTAAEWATSYAYNSNTTSVLLPTMTLAATTDLILSEIDINEATWGNNAPDMLQLAIGDDNANNDVGAPGGKDPDNPAGQVLFSYNDQMVTDLYFAFGRPPIATNTSGGRSGITGFTINSVPEPSTSLLCLVGSLGLLFSRRR